MESVRNDEELRLLLELSEKSEQLEKRTLSEEELKTWSIEAKSVMHVINGIGRAITYKLIGWQS